MMLNGAAVLLATVALACQSLAAEGTPEVSSSLARRNVVEHGLLEVPTTLMPVNEAIRTTSANGFWQTFLSHYDSTTTDDDKTSTAVASLPSQTVSTASTRRPSTTVGQSSSSRSTSPSPTTTATPTANSTSSPPTSLNGLFDTILDAFTCGGQNNLSATFSGLANLIGGLGGDPFFLAAAEGALYGNFTLFEKPAFFFGIGIGDAAIVGLNVTDQAHADGYVTAATAATTVNVTSSPSGAGPTSFNKAAIQLGRGLVNISLPAILASSFSGDFFSGLNMSEFARGGGAGFADGLGVALKPVLGRAMPDIFDVSVDNAAEVYGGQDPRGAGALAYAFAKGLASQVANLGLAVVGIKTEGSGHLLPSEAGNSGEQPQRFIGDGQGGSKGIAATQHTRRQGSTNSGAELIDASKTDELVSGFAQMTVSKLSCNGMGGIWAVALSALSGGRDSAIPSMPDLGGFSLPDIDMVVSSEGNTYEVNLKNISARINGIPMERFIGLLAGHVVIIMFALVGLFPTTLIVSAMQQLSSTTARPLHKDLRLAYWIRLTQVAVVPVLVIVGFALGAASGGSSRHFRTPHGVLGLVLVLLALAHSAFTLLLPQYQSRHHNLHHRGHPSGNDEKLAPHEKRSPPPEESSPEPSSSQQPTATKHHAFTNMLFVLLLMALIFATWVTGLDDLRTISLCLVEVTSLTLVAAVGAILNALCNVAVAAVVGEWWLSRRVASVPSSACGSRDGGDRRITQAPVQAVTGGHRSQVRRAGDGEEKPGRDHEDRDRHPTTLHAARTSSEHRGSSRSRSGSRMVVVHHGRARVIEHKRGDSVDGLGGISDGPVRGRGDEAGHIGVAVTSSRDEDDAGYREKGFI
ncbi:hypothetical protein Micbo1qcDRAFT_209429 [Microdochium bolleyi]|uniref:Cytochrome b561 domain-containing protein n=1 Tax=Microdochium bolleyi TaxID=196109 RepID=A0A136IM91_9PEZI|nr:hypothetical protein Micbo1qcDRAFT_209429 [Microdochium bolleyi]